MRVFLRKDGSTKFGYIECLFNVADEKCGLERRESRSRRVLSDRRTSATNIQDRVILQRNVRRTLSDSFYRACSQHIQLIHYTKYQESNMYYI